MPEYTVSPYIPLSWLRETWKHVRQLYLNNVKITHHDVWLWMVRQEIARLTIWELQKENYELKQKIRDMESQPVITTLADAVDRLTKQGKADETI